MRNTICGRIGTTMPIKYCIVAGLFWVLKKKKIPKNVIKFRWNRTSLDSTQRMILTFRFNMELKSSIIIWRSSIWRLEFLIPLAEYNGGRFDGGDGINLSSCKLSNRLWHTSFTFDMDNCINFKVWYSVVRSDWKKKETKNKRKISNQSSNLTELLVIRYIPSDCKKLIFPKFGHIYLKNDIDDRFLLHLDVCGNSKPFCQAHDLLFDSRRKWTKISSRMINVVL